MTTKSTAPTQPIAAEPFDHQAHITVAASYQDPVTKALYVHQDLTRVQEPWSEEAHIAPPRLAEQFGDIESFAEYVSRFGHPANAFLSWNSRGLRAVLDYPQETTQSPGRCQWTAAMPFRVSTAWQAWTSLANGQPIGQKSAIERIEDLAPDIVSPAPADLMGLLRTLRASVNARADTELRPDGTTKVAFASDTKVQTAKDLDLPASFQIAIPVLKGHVDEDGRPVLYRLDVRIRVSVDDSAHLALRFAMPTAERVLEDVYAERVAAAKALLGETFALLRSADA